MSERAREYFATSASARFFVGTLGEFPLRTNSIEVFGCMTVHHIHNPRVPSTALPCNACLKMTLLESILWRMSYTKKRVRGNPNALIFAQGSLLTGQRLEREVYPHQVGGHPERRGCEMPLRWPRVRCWGSMVTALRKHTTVAMVVDGA